MRENTRSNFIDVTMHQALRRDALAMYQAEKEPLDEPMTLNAFLWALFGIVCSLIAVLIYVAP